MDTFHALTANGVCTSYSSFGGKWILDLLHLLSQEIFKGMIRSEFTFNKVQETSLRIVRGINHSSYKNLLRKCKKITIHESVDDRNLQDY